MNALGVLAAVRKAPNVVPSFVRALAAQPKGGGGLGGKLGGGSSKNI